MTRRWSATLRVAAASQTRKSLWVIPSRRDKRSYCGSQIRAPERGVLRRFSVGAMNAQDFVSTLPPFAR